MIDLNASLIGTKQNDEGSLLDGGSVQCFHSFVCSVNNILNECGCDDYCLIFLLGEGEGSNGNEGSSKVGSTFAKEYLKKIVGYARNQYMNVNNDDDGMVMINSKHQG